MTRGQLRIYLGCAPGVGKTYAMLDEGARRVERGGDVVVGLVETHGRVHTAARLEDLEVVPRRSVSYRGTEFSEMDLPAVLARAPEVALVDELAHTNPPGLEHPKRWQDVEDLLAAGIDVVSTLNIQHLESLNDVVEAITGVAQRETVPDSVVRAAEQIELVDMTPEALRRRMAHGNIYPADRVDAALSNYFRPGNLTALRELALLWLAGSVEEKLQRYRDEHDIAATWETKERVVIALTGGPEGDTLIRRGARIAARSTGGDLLAVHVARSDGLRGSSIAALERQRLLVESLGGTYHQVLGDSTSKAVLDFARANNATQVVIGASRRSPLLAWLTGPGTGMTITRDSGTIDVHVVSHDYVGRGRRLPIVGGGLTQRRRLFGWGLAVVLLTLVTVLEIGNRHQLGLAADALLYMLAVVLVSLVGGFLPAFAAALAGSLLLNYYFVPPLHTFTIAEPENVLTLVVFVLAASLVSRVVDRAARRSAEAARSNSEAEILSTLAGSLLRGEEAIPALLARVQETFAVRSVSLIRRGPGDGADGGELVDCSGPPEPDADPSTTTEVAVTDGLVMVLRGRTLAAEDQRVLAAFATEVAVAYAQRRLAEAAAAAGPLAESDRTRAALLNAVSHDLRTPIASAKASVSSLRSTDIAWSDADRNELLASADAALDRLTALVTNLLDLSRIQAGVLRVSTAAVDLAEVVGISLGYLAPDHERRGVRVDVRLPDDLPEVDADAGLLERVLANLLDNAMRHSPDGAAVTVSASRLRGTVEVRIVDRGPGIPVDDRESVFAPFQRLDDHATSSSPGVGLGLAISKGFIDALRGDIRLEDTPGGGLTVVVALPVVGTPDAAAHPAPSGATTTSGTGEQPR